MGATLKSHSLRRAGGAVLLAVVSAIAAIGRPWKRASYIHDGVGWIPILALAFLLSGCSQDSSGSPVATGTSEQAASVSPSGLVAYGLQNGTATFSQSFVGGGGPFTPNQATDGNLGDSNGWSIARVDAFGGTNSETAVWETTTNLSAGNLTFTLHFNHFNPGHLLGRFRFSVTTDDRNTFADGLPAGGDVDANWIVLTNPIVSGPAGMTFTTLADHSILAGGTTAAQGVYTVSYVTAVSGITGVRLEALEDPALPGGNGPGLFPRVVPPRDAKGLRA